MNAWRTEPAARPEARWNRRGLDYLAWNAYSPEVAFCELVGAMVAIARPGLVVETGVGQGYATRRILKALPPASEYVGFESSDEWRARTRAFLPQLSTTPTPEAELLATADVVVFDSDPPFRQAELRTWIAAGRQGAVAVVHDVIPGRAGLKGELAAMLAPLGGLLTPNPRGGWIGRHP